MDDRKIVYPKQRELDGVYTRVERNGHWYSVCFSDLTDEEQDVYDIFVIEDDENNGYKKRFMKES